MIAISSENIVLLGAILLGVAVMAGKLASRFGAPALLFFLGAGMLFGATFISFHSVKATQFIGMISLSIILFSGGMDTKISHIRPITAPGVVLATLGVAVTALLLGGFVYLIAPWLGLQIPFALALLLAATMSSTDSASVFSILRSKSQGLKEHLRPLLELESGSNDPMAYMLVILLIGVLTTTGGGADVPLSMLLFMVQMAMGVGMGFLVGHLAVWTINRINLPNPALYPVLLLAFIFVTFSVTDLMKGNGYLAVYIAGLMVGNHKLMQKHALTAFFDGFTWLMQIVVFVTLGLLVNFEDLLNPKVLILGTLIGAFLILVARPIAVFACLSPFRRFSGKARVYVSWVGLRGAVPIIFATYPVLAGVADAGLMFNVVFLVTIISLIVQGTTVSSMARVLGLSFEEKESAFDVRMHEEMTAVLTEVEVNRRMLRRGDTLTKIPLPENTLVMMVCRDGDYFVPQGKTPLLEGDKLLVISDRNDELTTTYKDMGIDEVMKHE